MSRQFSTGAGSDSITFSPGGAPPDQGPITVAVLAKSASVAGFTMWMVRGNKAGSGVWSILTSNNVGPKLFAENDFGNGVAGLSTSWRWYVMTKAAGSALPRIHVWDLSGAWSHTDNTVNTGDNTGAIDAIIVGGNGSGSNGWRGSIAVVATWESVLSDAAIEAAMTLAAADTFAATPDWMIRLNQASTATSVTDDTGGGGDQTAITGTSVDADDPPSYDYDLTPPPTFETTMSAGVTAGLTLAGGLKTTETTGVTAGVSMRGALGTSMSRGVTAGLTLAGQLTHSMSMGAVLDLSLEGTVVGGQAAETPAGWNTIMGAVNEARAEHRHAADRARHPVDCPEHLWPLKPVGGNRYHCQFGGHVVYGR
jgi:hypothetical protein